MGIVEKIKMIREAEGFSQEGFARELDIHVGTLRQWEQGRRTNPKSSDLNKITNHPRFQKYTLWLMTGTTAPEAGQISPDMEIERAKAAGQGGGI